MQVGGFAMIPIVDTIMAAAHCMQINRNINRGPNNSIIKG